MADQPPTQSCGNCRYMQACSVWSEDGTIRYQDMRPVCKRNPPAAHQRIALEGNGYPQTHVSQWCGEWAPAAPETISDGCVTLARLVLLGDLTAARALADKLKEE